MLAAPAMHHVHDAKALANDERTAKQRLDLLRRGVGGHIKVLGAQAQQQVAHGTTHDVGLVARILSVCTTSAARRSTSSGLMPCTEAGTSSRLPKCGLPPEVPGVDLPSSLSMNFLIMGMGKQGDWHGRSSGRELTRPQWRRWHRPRKVQYAPAALLRQARIAAGSRGSGLVATG